MNCGYCKDCSFWEGYPHHEGKYGQCNNPALQWGNSAPEDGLGSGSEGCAAWILTGQNFGCIKFQPK